MNSKNGSRVAWQIAVIIIVMATCLRMMGRQWWCRCGTWVPWSWDIQTSHNSQHLLDPYSFTHVLHGIIFFWLLTWLSPRISQSGLAAPTRLLIAALIEAAWEILENSPWIIDRYRESTISLDYYGDSIANSISDVIACLLGYFLASKFRLRWSLGFILLTEVVLLLTIRDSLLLNVIMLVCPVEAIKQWQSEK
ncbi:DUF2585 family protein [Allorhodopirellula heiligendammensis]|nr:DUF2585 family protein [Allorhodopirellula heiligendammensis]